MRYRLPAVLAAVAIALGAATAPAATKNQRPPKRVTAHISLHLSRHNVLSGADLSVQGRLRPAGRHRVKVVVRGRSGGVVRARTGADGRFRTSWGLHRTGEYSVRAYGVHDRRVSGSASVARRIVVYRSAVASYYGPGLYGNGVACGGTLMPGTLGVANRTLPCGTMVRLRYRGRSVRVPVIDRGPYVAGRDYDLTEATRERLRFPGLGVLLASR
jgi:rare lipoprotein A